MITIVAIGKNEGKNIVELHKTILKLFNSVDIIIQTIYVDSASTDNSFEIAVNLFDMCYKMDDSIYNSASAGRYIGTLKAKHNWILYVDSDMELCEEIICFINYLKNDNNNCIGYIGNYINVLKNGKEIIVKYCNNNDNAYTDTIGGCVFLKRDIVLRAGNWTPSLYSLEENDLYLRIKKYGNIKYCDIPMVKHKTESYSKLENIRRLYLPWGGLGNKYYGLGQSLVSSIINRYFIKFILYYKKLFLHIFVNILGIVLIFKSGLTGTLLIILINIYIGSLDGWKKPLYYYADLLHILFGIRKYNSSYIPNIIEYHTNSYL